MERLHTSDYRGYNWPQSAQDEEEDGYPLYVAVLIKVLSDIYGSFPLVPSPLVMKVRSRAGSSGVSTPAGGVLKKSLSERDLQKADAALNEVNEVVPATEAK